MKTFLMFVFVFVFGINLAITFVNRERIKSLLVTRIVNNMRISELQKERKQMQKVIQRLSKIRGF